MPCWRTNGGSEADTTRRARVEQLILRFSACVADLRAPQVTDAKLTTASVIFGTTAVAGPGRNSNPAGTSSMSSEFRIRSAPGRANSIRPAAG